MGVPVQAASYGGSLLDILLLGNAQSKGKVGKSQSLGAIVEAFGVDVEVCGIPI